MIQVRKGNLFVTSWDQYATEATAKNILETFWGKEVPKNSPHTVHITLSNGAVVKYTVVLRA